MEKTICLVLGAGSSAWLGFPLGSDLRRKILELTTPDRSLFISKVGLYEYGQTKIRVFVEQFRKSQMYSIDAFLARRPEFTDIGKACIAALLIEAEHENDLFNTESEDNWYRYFFNKLSTESWETLDLSKIKVVTFNYDRSFEFYLKGAIQNAYGKTNAEVEERLKMLEIIHVYGSLGSVYESDSNFLNYGDQSKEQFALKPSTNIKVIPEGRNDEPTLEKAKALLKHAYSIAFLGFGFDSTNLARLDASNSCTPTLDMEGVYGARAIVATTKGLTDAETLKIAHHLNIFTGNSAQPPKELWSDKCLGLLRDTLILDSVD